MKAAIYRISDGFVLRKVEAPANHIAVQCQDGEEFFLNCPSDATHIIDRQPVTITLELVLPTQEELARAIVNAVQAHLDATARTRNYDNILSLATYATSTDPIFAAEAAAGILWRDACWRYCYQALSEVQAGLRPMPTVKGAIAELPLMVWPS